MSVPSRINTQKLESLQALRALAALLVVLSHALHEASGFLAAQGIAFKDKIIPGDAGVDIFFVLSGFIMVYVSAGQWGQPGAAQRFFLRRLTRVVPLYWFFTTLMLIIVIAAPSLSDSSTASLREIFGSYAFLPFARESDGLVRPILALGWTLDFEIAFYTLFALCLFLPGRMAVWATGFTLIVAATTGLVWAPSYPAFSFWTNPIILEFGLGMAIGWAYTQGLRLPASALLPGVVMAMMVLAIAPPLAHDMDPMRVIHYGLPAMILVSVCSLASSAKDHARLPAWITLHGDSSYSLYLSHPFTLGIVTVVWVRLDLHTLSLSLFGTGVSAWLYVVAAALACAVVGRLVYRYVEQPMLRVTNSWLNKSAPMMAHAHPEPNPGHR